MPQTLEMAVSGSVIPSNKDISDRERLLLGKLDSFEAPYLEEKLMEKGLFGSHEEYAEAFGEFKRFVALTMMYGRDMSMMSRKVDEVWHQFILFTPQYHQFCNDFLGGYMHHLPKTSQTPLSSNGRKNLINNYREAFGEMPSIWNVKSSSDPCEACGPAACAPDCSNER
ncbi:MAG: hypothetical protein Q8Q42_04115 [Nanoarchaeota archaeon]|nr:hypothetical protein [Nanoarchaeota archaeon]